MDSLPLTSQLQNVTCQSPEKSQQKSQPESSISNFSITNQISEILQDKKQTQEVRASESSLPLALQQTKDSLLASSQPKEESTQAPQDPHQKRSYVSAVQKSQSLTKHLLHISEVDGNKTVLVPDDIFEDSAPLWEDLLIGNFLSTFAPHVAKIHVIVNKIWTLGEKNVKIDVF